MTLSDARPNKTAEEKLRGYWNAKAFARFDGVA